MRGSDERSGSLFSYVDLEARVRADHPLRVIRDLANAALGDLSAEFGKLYTDFGRPSIAPERLLRAMLLQAFYGIRSNDNCWSGCSSTCYSAGLSVWAWTIRCGTTDLLQEQRPVVT